MIEVNNGIVKLAGDAPRLCTDLSVICRAIKESIEKKAGEESAKAMIYKAVDLAFKSDEEIHEECKAKVMNFIKDLLDSFDKEPEKNDAEH